MAVTQASAQELVAWQNVRADSLASLPPAEALAHLGSQSQGLSNQEAAARLHASQLVSRSLRRRWGKIARTVLVLLRPLLLPLWIGAAIAYTLDRSRTGEALLLVAVLNTLVAAIQERKAERATAALNDTLPTFARVLRDGREEHIMAAMLVPGDVLLLQRNDIIPADARLIQAHDLHTVDLISRGEGLVAHKTAAPFIDDMAPVAELPNMVYAGGRVTSGQGRAVVFATGLNSTFGKIAALTQRAQEEPSPLLLAFARLGNFVLTIGVLGAIGGYLYSVNALGLGPLEGLHVAVLFLTAAVPTGLMPGITLTLIEGARRLQQRDATFRRLSNVETLGATTVICADKTGTLTQNEMTARELWTIDNTLAISGVGYQPRGEFSLDQRPLDAATVQKLAGSVLRAAVLTSTARLLPPDTLRPHWHIVGDPVEAAQLVAAAKAEIKAADLYAHMPQISALNSDRNTALDGVIVNHHGQTIGYVKGKPMELLARCTAIATADGDRPLTDRDRQTIKRTLQRYQRDAMRTIAFARRAVNKSELQISEIGRIAQDLVFLGMLAVLDPPRQEVAAAIEACHSASIRTIMLTGDDTLAATSIARRCTMVRGAKPTVLSGPDLETMDNATLQQQLRSGDMVLARLTPEDKVRVVETLEQIGEVVLVTGGAASDVPALKAAYTGIAMGATGSPAACQAADLILGDDNFATIAAAIAEGRAVEQRVRRLVALNLATTIVKLVALVAAVVGGAPLLLTVGQQLLIDFLAGLLPGLALGAGKPDPRLMQRPPRPTGRPLLSRKVYLLGYGWFGGLAALFALAVSGAYLMWGAAENVGLNASELFLNNLLPYEERIGTEAGQLGLVATSLYVVVSIAALLGPALIRRSAAPNDRRPQLLLIGLVGLSFALLVAIIVGDRFHPYIALTNIPNWGWAAALGATALVALLEMLRQRIDPIFKPQPVRSSTQRLTNVQSPNES
jgi:magnesium-transporting ATPase (P-type)